MKKKVFEKSELKNYEIRTVEIVATSGPSTASFSAYGEVDIEN